MHKNIILLFTLTFLHHFEAFADLHPYYIRIDISAPKTRFTNSEIVQLNVSLKNLDASRHSVMTPGNQTKGKKMIYFSWYKVDEKNFYTEVHRDSREILMDTTAKGNYSSKYLEPKDSITLSFFLNDSANAKRHIYSSYNVPKLAPGKYKILAWYYPWDEENAKYYFNKVDWKEEYADSIVNSELLDLPYWGYQSSYFDVEIVEQVTEETTSVYTNACPKNCHFCHAIEKNRWNKVEGIIRKQSSQRSKFKLKTKKFGNWHKNHRKVAYYGPYPDAILSSLPSYTGIEIIFKNSKGYHYYALTWQIGKINRCIRTLNFITSNLFRFRFRDSGLDYYYLKKMQRWS